MSSAPDRPFTQTVLETLSYSGLSQVGKAIYFIVVRRQGLRLNRLCLKRRLSL